MPWCQYNNCQQFAAKRYKREDADEGRYYCDQHARLRGYYPEDVQPEMMIPQPSTPSEPSLPAPAGASTTAAPPANPEPSPPPVAADQPIQERPMADTPKGRSYAVKCVETGEVFLSAADACRHFGIATIYSALHSGNAVKGKHFVHAEPGEIPAPPTSASSAPRRRKPSTDPAAPATSATPTVTPPAPDWSECQTCAAGEKQSKPTPIELTAESVTLKINGVMFRMSHVVVSLQAQG